MATCYVSLAIYYVRNAQNDIVKLIDGSGNTVVEYTYDSWGKSISVTGTLATTLGANQPFRYRSYMYDTETGFYYLKSRYYDPAVCRFISSDVFLSTGQGVLGNNSYAYCNNNAINCADSSGHAAHFNNVMYVCDGGCNSSNKGIQTNTTGKKVDKSKVLIGGLNKKGQKYKKPKSFFPMTSHPMTHII